MKSSFALAALAGLAAAVPQPVAVPDQDAAYERMENGIRDLGYTIEKMKIKNDLGYLCDMYHITGTTAGGPFKPTKNAVLFTHGLGGDSTTCLGVINALTKDKEPQAFQLAQRGYDVWLGNNSGTYFCYEHETLTFDDPKFWDIDWKDFGVSDTKAQVEEIQKHNGGQKVGYVGISQGTTQGFAAIATIPEWFDENVNFMAMLGPCTIMTPKYVASTYTKEVMDWLKANEIYALGGPYWSTRDRALILESAPQALKDSMGLFEVLKNFTVKTIAHYSQCGATFRFQEYIEDWFELPEDKPKHSPLLDIGRIQKTNIGLFVGLFDDTCPTSHAVDIKEDLGDQIVTHYRVSPWNGHATWASAANKWYIDELDRLLQTNMERTNEVLQ